MSSNSPAAPAPPGFASPPITILLTTVLLVFFFIGFFSIYFCRCFMEGMLASWNMRRGVSGNTVNPAGAAPASNGLDPSLIQLFPTFTYSNVKELRKEKCDLECAICLAEVLNDDLLRLLTVCYHCFHKECIDLWLESHKTCPVCRRDLDLPKEDLEKSSNTATIGNANETINDDLHQDTNNNSNSNDGVALEHAISITINDGEEDAAGEVGRSGPPADPAGVRQVTQERIKAVDIRGGLDKFKAEGLPRSHSTGHSLVMQRGPMTTEDQDHDKYTLRLLPEHVPKVKVAGAGGGHRGATLSCIAFGEFSSSSGPNRSVSRLASMSTSDRTSNLVGDANKLCAS